MGCLQILLLLYLSWYLSIYLCWYVNCSAGARLALGQFLYGIHLLKYCVSNIFQGHLKHQLLSRLQRSIAAATYQPLCSPRAQYMNRRTSTLIWKKRWKVIFNLFVYWPIANWSPRSRPPHNNDSSSWVWKLLWCFIKVEIWLFSIISCIVQVQKQFYLYYLVV